MKVKMLGSNATMYHGFDVYNEYEKIIDEEENRIIYTYNSAVINKKEISNHYGYLKYVGKGYFFFIPFMDFSNKVGLFKMQMINNELVPFSEEVISEDIKRDKKRIIKLFQDNEMNSAIRMLDKVFDNHCEEYMSSYYNEVEYRQTHKHYSDAGELESNFDDPLPEGIKAYQKK